MKKILLLLFCFPMLAFQCDDDERRLQDMPCTMEARAGINVTVSINDASTTVTEGITVVITDGDYSETLETPVGNDTFSGAYERAGTYMITVSKEGYATHTSDPITVTRDRCHVIPKLIHVNLQPI